VAPGTYSAQLVVVSSGGVRSLGPAQTFEVKPVPNLIPGTDVAAVAAFQEQTAELRRRVGGAGAEIGRVKEQLRQMRAALVETPKADPALYGRVDSLAWAVADLERRLFGDPARGRLHEPGSPSIAGRVGEVAGGHWETTQMPTATQRKDIEIASAELETVSRELQALITGELARLEAALEAAGAPYHKR
jgi:hypothetical protein